MKYDEFISQKKYDEIICQRKDKTLYRDGNILIKVFNENYSKANVLNEALNQARVEELDLNVPKLHEVTRIDGKWAIVMDYIEGKTLRELMNESPEKTDEYLEKLVDLQLQVHSKSSPLLTKNRSKMSRKIEESGLDATTRYELQTRISGMKKHNKVCHGDFVPSNIVITPEGEAYIIDWSHVTQGNGSADAARTYLMFCLYNQEDNAKKYLDIYSKKANAPKQVIQRWMPIVAASRLVKNVPEEREFLLNWTNVTDY